jgi:hypothetical protein
MSAESGAQSQRPGILVGVAQRHAARSAQRNAHSFCHTSGPFLAEWSVQGATNSTSPASAEVANCEAAVRVSLRRVKFGLAASIQRGLDRDLTLYGDGVAL